MSPVTQNICKEWYSAMLYVIKYGFAYVSKRYISVLDIRLAIESLQTAYILYRVHRQQHVGSDIIKPLSASSIIIEMWYSRSLLVN